MDEPRKSESWDLNRSYPSSPELELPNWQQNLADTQMEKLRKAESLDPNRDFRRRCSYPGSPEFEFWMVRNPSLPVHNMITADELFVDGVLLPLDLVPVSAPPCEVATPVTSSSVSEPGCVSGEVPAGPELTAAVTAATGSTSTRWKDIFRKSESKAGKETDQGAESTKAGTKREGKTRASGGGGWSSSSTAELNINIWPFSRSRSDGTGGARPKVASSGRKVSSAPCSRSNSGGESKSRKWPASPGRAGVHVGRSSPVWHVRRGGSATVEGRKSGISGSGKEMNSKCRKKMAASSAPVNGGDLGFRGCSRKGSGGSNSGTGVVNIFNFRSLFSKKVY
uniref:Uncharacterized protein n=1 Tax=Kalanchoe fedtschenkoi TaxID=63787 RepID=A0A7N0VGS7_KALFE